jgi:hypothetical protein
MDQRRVKLRIRALREVSLVWVELWSWQGWACDFDTSTSLTVDLLDAEILAIIGAHDCQEVGGKPHRWVRAANEEKKRRKEKKANRIFMRHLLGWLKFDVWCGVDDARAAICVTIHLLYARNFSLYYYFCTLRVHRSSQSVRSRLMSSAISHTRLGYIGKRDS